MKKRIIIKDWYILPSWGRGLALGAIIGSILMIPSAFFINNFLTATIPFAILIVSSVVGVIVSKNKKSFCLRHKT